MARPREGWRWAEDDDVAALSVFECADPVKPKKTAASGWRKAYHPRQWEYDAQQIIRTLALRIPPPPSTKVLVFADTSGIGAVGSWTALQGPGLVHIDVMGVANRHRRCGGAVARRLAREVVDRIEAAAIEAGLLELWVECEIYRLNGPSQALCGSLGMSVRETHPGGAQTWARLITLQEAFDLPGLTRE